MAGFSCFFAFMDSIFCHSAIRSGCWYCRKWKNECNAASRTLLVAAEHFLSDCSQSRNSTIVSLVIWTSSSLVASVFFLCSIKFKNNMKVCLYDDTVLILVSLSPERYLERKLVRCREKSVAFFIVRFGYKNRDYNGYKNPRSF